MTDTGRGRPGTPADYAEDFAFFERFRGSGAHKAAERFSLLRRSPGLLLRAPLLYAPLWALPGPLKKRALSLKYRTDLEALRKGMPRVFRGGRISVLGMDLTPPGCGDEVLYAERILSTLGLINDIFIKDQYDLVALLAGRKGAVVLDCGANIGIFSIFAGRLAADSRIFAFEPAEETFSIMSELLRRNGVSAVEPLNLAVGDAVKETVLLKSGTGVGLSNVMSESAFKDHEGAKYGMEQKVSVSTLDDFVLGSRSLERVDLIKIDTEGFERQVIKGAAGVIRKFGPAIVCSAYHLPGDDEAIPALITEIDPSYKVRLVDRGDRNLVFYK
jgi:FkbM family methyltransferase